MKVKLLTDVATLSSLMREDEVHDLPKARARELIQAGQAEEVRETRNRGNHELSE